MQYFAALFGCKSLASYKKCTSDNDCTLKLQKLLKPYEATKIAFSTDDYIFMQF